MSNQINQEMSLSRLSTLVDSYGAHLSRMPEGERGQVETLLSRSREAQALWQAAAQLDALLDEEPATLTPSAALMQRLQAIPAEEGQLAQVIRLPRRANVWASLAAAAALLLGVITGSQQDEGMSAEDDSASLSELGALAFSGELVTDLGQFEGDLE